MSQNMISTKSSSRAKPLPPNSLLVTGALPNRKTTLVSALSGSKALQYRQLSNITDISNQSTAQTRSKASQRRNNTIKTDSLPSGSLLSSISDAMNSSSSQTTATHSSEKGTRCILPDARPHQSGPMVPCTDNQHDITSSSDSQATMEQHLDINGDDGHDQQQAMVTLDIPPATYVAPVIGQQQPSHLVEGIHNDQPLINIPLEKLGTLLGYLPSLEFIPERLVRQVRHVYNYVMEQLLSHRNNPTSDEYVLWWKKFVLLPMVLLSPLKKSDVKRHAQLVLRDEWPFKLSDFRAREVRYLHPDHAGNGGDKKVQRLIGNGMLSKAFSVLCNKLPPPTPSQQVFEQLQDKHPHTLLENFNNMELINSIRDFEIPQESKLIIESEDLLVIIRRLKKDVKPGVDKLRNKHLQQLVGYRQELDADEQQFLNYLTEIINMVVHGREPAAVAAFLSSNELFAAPKPNGDVRPIGIGSTLRKLAATICMQASQRELNMEHFGNLQYGMRPGGMEEIIHMFATTMELSPGSCVLCIDADNAFNMANRITGLQQVMEKFPSALAYARDMYLEESSAWFYGLPDNIKAIMSRNGFHQGDVLASWMYMMTIHPLLVHIAQELKTLYPDSHTLVKFYVDDGNFSAPYHIMLKIVEIVQGSYERFGFKMKMNKGSILLGRCTHAEEAEQQRSHLLEMGFDPSIIHIHPDNVVDIESKQQAMQDYGVKLLGSFVGHDAYVSRQLVGYFEDLEQTANYLMDYPDLQGRMLMFRYCFMSKPYHLMRTTRPDLLSPFVVKLQLLQRKVLASIFGIPHVSDALFNFCCLQISSGGLGIHRADEVCDAAYAASMVSFFQSSGFDAKMQEIAGLQVQEMVPRLRQLMEVVKKFKLGDGLDVVWEDEVSWFVAKLRQIQQLTKSGERDTLQNKLTYHLQDQRKKTMKLFLEHDPDRFVNLRWWNSLQNAEAGAWLDVIPKIAKFTMRSSEFRTALLYRYRVPIPSIRDGTRCDCKVTTSVNGHRQTCHPKLDLFGYHLSTGCGKDSHRINTHNMLVLELNSLLRYAGGYTVREERHCFSRDLPDNNHRPDISILNPEGLQLPGKKVLLDVAVTCPLDGAQSGKIKTPTLQDAKRPLSANATSMFNSKLNKYRGIFEACEAATPNFDRTSYVIYPMVFESTGGIHPDSLKFLRDVLKKAAEVVRFPEENLTRYFMKRLSVCLQIQLARAINSRISKLMAHEDFQNDRNFAAEVIGEEEG